MVVGRTGQGVLATNLPLQVLLWFLFNNYLLKMLGKYVGRKLFSSEQ